MTPARLRYSRAITAAVLAAGSVGVVLTAANVSSPIRAPLVLLFLAVAPAAAVLPLLGRFDLLARLVIAGATAVAVNFLVAEIMLAAGLWSPRGGAAAVAVLTAAAAAARLTAIRVRRARGRATAAATAPRQ